MLTTADGRPLKEALRRAESRARLRAFMLVAPLLLFILASFIFPIGQMLVRSIKNDGFTMHSDVGSDVETPIMTNVRAWFDATDRATPPDEAAFAALRDDLVHLAEIKGTGSVSERLNYNYSGASSMIKKAARNADDLEPPYAQAFVELDAKWAEPALWAAMRDAAHTYTLDFYLSALDMERTVDGDIVKVDETRRVYIMLFARTLLLSLGITLTSLILAYPIAHLLAVLPLRVSNLLMIFVLLPFWTSLLVRTTSWMVLLQSQGVVNDILVAVGVIGDGNRLQMMYNMVGTIIAMTHILLPFMVLPLYSVMRTIKPSYVRAARSLGATSWTAFRRVYFPQTVPGIGAGALLVFILAVGYYITPALVGGSDGQLISNLIAFHMQKSLNWSLAAALAAILLFGVLVLYWLYDRFIGIDNLKLG